MKKEYYSGIIQYKYSFSFINKLSDASLRKAYTSLLNNDIYDGYSTIEQSSEDGELDGYFIITSKDRKYSLTGSGEDVDIEVRNAFTSLDVDLSWLLSDHNRLIEEIVTCFKLEDNLASVALSKDNFILNTLSPQAVAKKIFAEPFADSFGFTAKFMQHNTDTSLKEGHTHSFLAIYNAAVGEMVEQLEKIEDNEKLNSYIVAKQYKYDSDEDRALDIEDAKAFFDKYFDIADREIQDACHKVGLLMESKGDVKA